jgi:fatty acid desaturase
MTTKAMVRRAERRKRQRLFSHPEDKNCAIFNLVVLACYGAAFWLYRNPAVAGIDGPWDRAAFALGAGLLLGWISGVNVGVNFHNHAHRPIFRSTFLNRWFERFWTFSGGWPAFYWRHQHVTVHHDNLLGETDWTMPRRRRDGRFENIYLYILCHWPWRYAPHLVRDFRAGRGGDWVGRKAVKEGLIFLALWSVPFLIDPLMGCLLWLFPQWIGNAVIMGTGMYVQHADCVPKSDEHPYRHSNAFLSPFFNLTMFNIGYHVVHHDFAQVHWSVLPAFHRRMKKRLVTKGVHVVPYGYYHAASICSSLPDEASAFGRFATDQAPGYGSPSYRRGTARRGSGARTQSERARVPASGDEAVVR